MDTIEKVAKACTGGATIKEIMDRTNLKRSAVTNAITILYDNGEIEKSKESGGTVEIEYYFLGEITELADLKPIDRKELTTGIRMNKHEAAIHRMLKSRSMTVGEISRTLNPPTGVSKEYVYSVLQSLREKGFSVAVDEARKQATLDIDVEPQPAAPLELEPLYKHKITIGAISDTHFGSKYQQPTLVQTAYQIFDEEKVDFVLHLGDLVEGMRLYRGQDQEIFLHAADEQAAYVLNNYPYRKDYKTYIISGSHDLVFKKLAGFDIVNYVCGQRDDLVYKGEHGAHTFKMKNLTFDVLHPSGGVPYAKSYRLQKVIEGALGDIISRLRATKDLTLLPQFMLMGHLHIMNYTPHIGVDGFMVPCLQTQTPYLKAKGLMPELGILIIHVECDDDWNINRLLLDHRKFNSYAKERDY
jgi:predicted phosphodiesterase